MNSGSLREFIAYIKSFWGAVSGLFAIVPQVLMLFGEGVTPPWLEPEVTATVTAGTCMLVLVAVFFGIRDYSRRRMRRWGWWFFALFVAGGIAWLVTNTHLVVTLNEGGGNGEHRVVRGFSLQEEARKAVHDGRVARDDKALLNDYGWESSETIWTHVPLAEILVVLAYVLPFVGAVGTLCAFALLDFKGSGGGRTRAESSSV